MGIHFCMHCIGRRSDTTLLSLLMVTGAASPTCIILLIDNEKIDR